MKMTSSISSPQRWPARALRFQGATRRLAAFTIVILLFTGCNRSDSTSSADGTRRATITAKPNPVPAGRSRGTTTITWDTDDGSPGEVYVSANDGKEQLFSRHAKASREANWIDAGRVYEFRLYRGTNRQDVLASVTVRRKP